MHLTHIGYNTYNGLENMHLTHIAFNPQMKMHLMWVGNLDKNVFYFFFEILNSNLKSFPGFAKETGVGLWARLQVLENYFMVLSPHFGVSPALSLLNT